MAIGYSTGPVPGVDFGGVSSVPVFKLGEQRIDSNGTTYIYVKGHSSTALTRYLVAQYNSSFQVSSVGMATADFGTVTSNIPALDYNLGVFQGKTGQTTLPSIYYGWLAIQGPLTVSTAGAVTAGAVVYSTSTAGKVDDAAGAGANARIRGLYVITDPGAAGDASCFAKVPLVAGF